MLNTGHHSTARAVEHHIHKAEEVLGHTVALHCTRIVGTEAREFFGADTLEEENPEDLAAIAGAVHNTGILAEDMRDTVAEMAVQIGSDSRDQDQWVDEWYRIGFVCLEKQLVYYHLPQKVRYHQCQDRQHPELCQSAPTASLLFCPGFLLQRSCLCCQRSWPGYWEVHHGYGLDLADSGERCGSCHVSRYLILGGHSGSLLYRVANVPNAQQHCTCYYATRSDDLGGQDDGMLG